MAQPLPNTPQLDQASVAKLLLEVSIDAPAAKVWRTIVDAPDAWWVSELRCVPGDSTITLEPRAGGQMVEHNTEGGSLLWFIVTAVEPGRSLNLASFIAPPFGGPATSFLLIEVDDHGERSTVRMTHSLHGMIDPDMLPEFESGWRLLLDNGIKQVAETGQRK